MYLAVKTYLKVNFFNSFYHLNPHSFELKHLKAININKIFLIKSRSKNIPIKSHISARYKYIAQD